VGCFNTQVTYGLLWFVIGDFLSMSFSIPTFGNLKSASNYFGNGSGPIGMSFTNNGTATQDKTTSGVDFSGMATGGRGHFGIESMGYQKRPIDPVMTQGNIEGTFGGNSAINAKTFSLGGGVLGSTKLNASTHNSVEAMSGPQGQFHIQGGSESTQWL
jgi:hypothetical protein